MCLGIQFHPSALSQNGEPMSFRYNVVPGEKLNCFTPEALPENTDKMSIRATQFGGSLAGEFHCFPQSLFCRTLWEAGI